MAWWDSNGYKSQCLPSVESEEEEEEEAGDDSSVCSTDSEEHNAIRYVLGDVTHPHATREDAIIVHCVGKAPFQPKIVAAFVVVSLRHTDPQEDRFKACSNSTIRCKKICKDTHVHLCLYCMCVS